MRDRAEIFRGVPEPGDFSEEAAHLQFRMHPGRKSPVDLDDALLGDDDGRVALFAADAAGRSVRRHIQRAQRIGAGEADRAVRCGRTVEHTSELQLLMPLSYS